MLKTKIISISSVSGGGKTTIAKLLNLHLEKSKVLLFDDYSVDGPEDFSEWASRGGDYNEWDITPIIMDINELSKGNINWLILDFPFSYLHKDIKDLINISIYLDTPLDVAMARRYIRDHKELDFDFFSNINTYLEGGRNAYITMIDKVKPSCDFIVDGTKKTEDIIRIIIEKMASSK